MTPQPQDDSNWQAFRYVAGEMDAAERDTFELQLAESQSAREAVAAEVELRQAARLALETEAVVPRPASHGFRTWWLGVAMGSAACLLIMWGVQQAITPDRAAVQPESEDHPGTVESQVDGALAARWSEVRQREDDPWGELSMDDEFADTLSSWDIETASENEAADDEATPSAPEWMMAAVSAAKQSQGMGDEMDMERAVDGPVEQ